MVDDQAYQGAMDLHSGNTPENAMNFIVKQALASAATATLVVVRSVDVTKERVDVQPMVHQVDGFGQIIPHGVIHDLPYLRLQAGSCAVILDPQLGDIGLAVFASTDITSVKANKAPSQPGSRRRNDWVDGIYIGGLLNKPATQFIRLSPDDGVTITSGDGLPITINAPGGCTVSSPTVTMTGDLDVTGAITSGYGSIFGGISFQTHQHGGVQKGTDFTGKAV